MKRRFHQVDVFGHRPLAGNPLAVVHDADGLSDDQMASFARWTNLSETTFLLPPTDPAADYRVRIFTPHGELPFAGHPTLGSAWAWLAAGGRPRDARMLMQQCGVGIVRVRCAADAPLAFAAPPLRRSGPLQAEVLTQACRSLGLVDGDVLHHAWADNGPPWSVLMLRDAATVRALKPDYAAMGDLKLGVVGAQPAGSPTQFEVRAFVGTGGFEDPVTGSLNAGIAQWLIGAGLAPERYVASQGAALQRDGRVLIERDGETVWVGGAVTAIVDGSVAP